MPQPFYPQFLNSPCVENSRGSAPREHCGLRQLEQGNHDQAQYHLSKIAAPAGTNSEEYRSLAAALEHPPGTGLIY